MPEAESLRSRLWDRLRACRTEKARVLLGLTAGICVPYFSLQRLRVFPLRSLPVTPLDHWIEFDPGWIGAYFSLALLVPIAPLLAARREELIGYAKGLTLLCLPAFAAFLLLPVEGPRPGVATAHAPYQLLVAYDGAANAFPSLHAGLAVFSLLFAYRAVRGELAGRGRAALAIVGGVWGAAILYATLATKQHWAIDLAPGILLGVAANALAWRRSPRTTSEGQAAVLSPPGRRAGAEP